MNRNSIQSDVAGAVLTVAIRNHVVMDNKPLIYIAGPYTNPDPIVNTRNAVEVGMIIYGRTGCPVIIPHLTLLAHAMFPKDIDYWYEFDLALIDHCDAILRLPGMSTGSDKEVEFANSRGIPVFWSRDSLYPWIEQF